MWIKSQNNDVIQQCNGLFVQDKNVCTTPAKGAPCNAYQVLGKNPTTEEALDVLETVSKALWSGRTLFVMPQ